MHKKFSAGTGTYSIIFGVAFVWFTTHFGGGFASGAQITVTMYGSASGV